MSLSNNFPVNSSNLNLSLANAGRLDPRVTFTRASTGTYYDGYSSAKAEENFLTRSQEFNISASWAVGDVTVSADATTAPDGTSTADKLQETATTAQHFLFTGYSFTSGLAYTLSVFAKKSDRNFVVLRLPSGAFTSNTDAFFNLDTGAVGTTANSPTTSIVDVGNGWYRCSITKTATASSNSNLQIFVASVDGTLSYAGTAGNGIFIWGAQLEQRSSVTSYTATTTAPITNYIPVLQTAAADVPRFDHNPTTRAALGLLVEEQRANICLQSEDFATTWTNTGSTEQTNIIVSPAGTLTGDKLVEDTSNGSHLVTQNITYSAVTYTASLFAKKAERDWVRVLFFDGTNTFSAFFNLNTGAVGTVTGTGASAAIQNVGNGWYRCSVTATTAAGSGSFAPRIALADNNSSYLGDGYSGIYIWGAQLEAGAFPTSYIATTTASVTRNADSATMTGTNFSAWYNATAGTLYTDFTPVGAFVAARVAASLNDGSTANFMYIGTRNASATYGANNRVSSGTIVAIGSFGAANTSNQKATFAYSSAGQSVTFNAAAVATATETVPTVTQMNFGGVTSISASTYIRRLTYYPVRNSDAQLQALTG